MKPYLLRLHPDVEAAVNTHREELEETFNEYIVRAVLKRLPKDVRKELPKPQKRGRPKSTKPEGGK